MPQYLDGRPVAVEALLVAVASMVGYYFIATSHATVTFHDLLLADIVVLSISIGVLLIDLIDLARKALGRLVS